MGKATKGVTFDNGRRFWHFQHHANDGSLRDKATNVWGRALVAFGFDNGLVEARSVVTVDGVDPFKQMIWKVRAGVGLRDCPLWSDRLLRSAL